MEKKNTNKKFITIFLTLIIVGGSYGTYKYLHAQSHELTDDAQIEKKMNPIIPRVSGYVDKVYVKDNDYVKKGDTLFTIDQRDFKIKIEEAKATLVAAESSFEVSKADISGALASIAVSNANVQSAGGNIEAAKIRLGRLTSDYNRYNNLYKNHSITKQQYEQAKASVQSVGQILTTPPPSSVGAEVAKDVVQATAPIQALRRHRYY
jgi:membrane fusion protein (multidrug efflux system)